MTARRPERHGGWHCPWPGCDHTDVIPAFIDRHVRDTHTLEEPTVMTPPAPPRTTGEVTYHEPPITEEMNLKRGDVIVFDLDGQTWEATVDGVAKTDHGADVHFTLPWRRADDDRPAAS